MTLSEYGQEVRAEDQQANSHRDDGYGQHRASSHIFGPFGQGMISLCRQINDRLHHGVEHFRH